MKIVVPRERRDGEKRVAASPESVKKFVALGASVTVEAGAGVAAGIADAAFQAAGAAVATDAAALAAALAEADLVAKVQRPTPEESAAIRPGAAVVALMSPAADPAALDAARERGLAVFGLEFVPRITRAQTMDVLSSQANLAGYRAVIDAAYHYAKCFPMFMTAAGTVQAARCFVLGAGVAGLQAIATARRMGCQVSATDVRKAAGEQVESLGAKYVFIDLKDGEGGGGYARALTPEEQNAQGELVANHIKNQDIVVTTAQIPGRAAPRLVTRAMIDTMKPGAVIVDLAVESGGNVEGSVAGQVVEIGGVTIVGYDNVPSRIAVDASALFARNVFNFVQPMVDKETKAFKPNWDDEVVKGALLAREGKIVHPALAPKAIDPPTAPPKAVAASDEKTVRPGAAA